VHVRHLFVLRAKFSQGRYLGLGWVPAVGVQSDEWAFALGQLVLRCAGGECHQDGDSGDDVTEHVFPRKEISRLPVTPFAILDEFEYSSPPPQKDEEQESHHSMAGAAVIDHVQSAPSAEDEKSEPDPV
jgi:hypothetical protein